MATKDLAFLKAWTIPQVKEGDEVETMDTTCEIINEEPVKQPRRKHFIEANTQPIDLINLKNECVVPVFSKDNEITISHPNFIETVYNAAQELFRGESIDEPDIMVSHVIKGRIPEAIHKPVAQLLDSDKTIYYERMAFAFEIPSIHEDINGNRLNLCITGVRAYNRENLHSKKTAEKFSISIGFKNLVCCNLCTFTDGYKADLKAMSCGELFRSTIQLFQSYNASKHLEMMKELTGSYLTEHQFAQFIGKSRLYQCLPSKEQRKLPSMELTDSQINMVAKSYYHDDNFKKEHGEKEINLWKFYNMLTSANKSSYIDNLLDRSLNASQLAGGINRALKGDNDYKWFIE